MVFDVSGISHCCNYKMYGSRDIDESGIKLCSKEDNLCFSKKSAQ